MCFEQLRRRVPRRHSEPLGEASSTAFSESDPAVKPIVLENQRGRHSNDASGQGRRRRLDDTKLDVEIDAVSGIAPPKSKKPRRAEGAIAMSVAQMILEALREIRKRPADVHHAAVDGIRSGCLVETDKGARLELLRQMADKFWKDSQGTQSAISWANRFFSSCMRFIIRRRYLNHRDDSKHRLIIPFDSRDQGADSTHAVNLAVNRLCAAQGLNGCRCATSIYTALASEFAFLMSTSR